MLLPHFVPGLGSASRIARSIAATNDFFEGKRAFYLPSDNHLYILPSQIATAMVQAQRMAGSLQESIIDAMLFSLRDDIRREMQETGTKRCIIDTSPFFSGATHLSWHACDAMIIPARTDQQSINSLTLLICGKDQKSIALHPQQHLVITQPANIPANKKQPVHIGYM